MTPARLAANRRNARKSTGPRTARGKAQSRMNGLKSGVYPATPPGNQWEKWRDKAARTTRPLDPQKAPPLPPEQSPEPTENNH